MVRNLAIGAAIMLLCAPAAPGWAQQSCRLCYGDGGAAPGERPLTIEIWTDLNFSKLALTGRAGGSAELSATGGGKQTTGEVIDLGGISVTGHGKITGVPLREVRIELPDQIEMTTPDGGRASLVQFTTDLPAHPALNATGELEFSFGARLLLSGGRGGNYRGRIPISVDYN